MQTTIQIAHTVKTAQQAIAKAFDVICADARLMNAAYDEADYAQELWVLHDIAEAGKARCGEKRFRFSLDIIVADTIQALEHELAHF